MIGHEPACEPLSAHLLIVSPILQDGFPTLEPPEDAMVEDAEELVDLLNGKIENLAYTGPVRSESPTAGMEQLSYRTMDLRWKIRHMRRHSQSHGWRTPITCRRIARSRLFAVCGRRTNGQ